MILLTKLPKDKIEYYIKMLKSFGSLSYIFSDNKVPYLSYRISENLFCHSFSAENIARLDCSIDAKIKIDNTNWGIGIKTFIHKSQTSLQKIAEFNSSRKYYSIYENKPEKLIREIAKYRNKRIFATREIYNINKMVYHNIMRKENKFILYEEFMEPVDIDNISKITKTNNIYKFIDGINEYSFNISKSTLYKKFNKTNIDNIIIDIAVVKDPFLYLSSKLGVDFNIGEIQLNAQRVILPLYSYKKGEKIIPEKSGLNQWNAFGRKRNSNEVYIKIPSIVNRNFPGFFPNRDKSFTLKLSNSKILKAKICQDNNKALMSNPNSDLGKWILRDILDIEYNKLITYKNLVNINIDSIEVIKESNNKFALNFLKLNSYENFKKRLIND